ncbi:MAG: DUF6788 family protein [PVC group bacterium]
MKRDLNQMIRRFNICVTEAKPEGYILQGSVLRRYLQRSTISGDKAYGPYYIWTRKIDNKTITKALTPEQAKMIRDAICRNRALEQRLAQIRSLSEEIINSISPGVPTRKRIR